MALDYTLALIGGTTPDAMAERLGFTRQESDEAMRVLHKLVARALATGDEDMLFLGPDDFLRFERVNGLVRRRRQLTS